MLDTNSFAFTNFANQPPGYYTPTPGGTTLYHSQAGDLHTPGMGMHLGMGLGTPLSMPPADHSMHGMMAMNNYHPAMNPYQFHEINPFNHHSQQHSLLQQNTLQPATFAPSSFIHQDTGYETMEHDGSPMDDDGRMKSLDSSIHQSPLMYQQQPQHASSTATPVMSGERFRFHVTLNAPTAMIKHSDEIPVTYLNKGQAYSVQIIDSEPTLPLPIGARYRTFVRISFEDEQQRQKPAFCWQLWKEGRGTNEAHQRGGKLQAVEYVEANQPAESDDKRTRVELDTASFDGFSVIWTPGVNGLTECNIAVRFNFLSTDFSHSKGVKGIPVRLCAKTEMIEDMTSPHTQAPSSEVCFCKVKLFRDHGAERKLSNDVAHVKKTIDKLKQQITQAESGLKDFSKRRRSGSISRSQAPPQQRPGKVQKHKRTWSMSSASSSGGGRPPAEEDLHFKLQSMQDMFTSTRPISVLYLRGDSPDDPDLHPVALVGEPLDLTKVDSKDSAAWRHRLSGSSVISGAETSTLVSPSASSLSLQSLAATGSHAAQPYPPPSPWMDVKAPLPGAQAETALHIAQPPDQLTQVPRRMPNPAGPNAWIDAMEVDAAYQAPAETQPKPVACFYILHQDNAQPAKRDYHRAVYLMRRSLQDFIHAIASKWNIDGSKVARVLHVLPRGLQVAVDDDVIRELAEGQDLILEICRLDAPQNVKSEWTPAVDAVDSTSDVTQESSTTTYELRLIF